MRLTHKEIAQNLKWFDELKILPAARVARELAIKALQDLQEIDTALQHLHDNLYEGVHGDECVLQRITAVDEKCDCGFGPICELLGTE